MAASGKKKRFWIWAALIVVCLVVAAGVAVAKLASGTSIDPNRLAKVTRADVARSVVATGKIEPITKVEVKSKASGIVEKLFVDINYKVQKGQQLAQLDQQEIADQVEAQRAQLAAAEANVSTYQANIDQDKVNAAAPDLPMYKATLDRNTEMQREGVVSRQALDDANKDYLAALTRRDSAKAQIGVDTAKLQQAKAQVQQSQASLKQLEEQLSYTTIVAPMDGVILSRDVEIDERVWRSTERVWRSTVRVWRSTVRVWRSTVRVWRNTVRVWRSTARVWRSTVRVWRSTARVWRSTERVWRSTARVWRSTARVWRSTVRVWRSTVRVWRSTVRVW